MRDDMPISWDTASEPSAFDPEDWLAHCEVVTGRTRPSLPALCVQTVVPPHLHAVCDRFGLEPDDFTQAGHPFVTFQYRDRDVVLGASAKGSYAAGGLDELIALGARSIVVLGGAGSLVGHVAVGDYVVATKALRDEGVSFHYAPPSRYSLPSSGLTRALGEAVAARVSQARTHFGPVWTTTAHFRQTVARVRAFRAEGCLAVNNEAAAAFAVGRHRQVAVASLLRIGDTLAEDRFTVPPHGRVARTREDLWGELEVALDALLAHHGDAECAPSEA
jgi:uridine phosphorylase